MLKKSLLRLITAIFVLAATFGATAPAEAADPNVATVKIVSYGPGGTKGHSFIVVKNTSAKTVAVGTYNLSSGATISVGTWGNRDDGRGVYYNLELYYANKSSTNVYPNRVSKVRQVTANQLASLTSLIKSRNTWTPTNNCSSFAKDAWNKVNPADQKVSMSSPNTPTKLAESIKKLSGLKETNTGLPARKPPYIRKQSGSSHYEVSSKTLSGAGGSSS